MMAILSPRRSASSMKWVVKMIVRPDLYFISRSQIALREYGSTPAVGSSNTTTLNMSDHFFSWYHNFNSLWSSHKSAGDAEFSLHSPGQIFAKFVFFVGNPKVSDHLLIFLLSPHGVPGVLMVTLQLRIEPEVLRDSQPAPGQAFTIVLEADWCEIWLRDGVEDDCVDCDSDHYRFLFSQSVNDLTQ